MSRFHSWLISVVISTLLISCSETQLLHKTRYLRQKDVEKLKYGKITFRNSTFPFVPNYIRFCRQEQPCLGSKSYLDEWNPPKWKYSYGTFTSILTTVTSSGFRLNGENQASNWLGFYISRDIAPEKRYVREFQKINKLPIYTLYQKDFLANKVQHFIAKYGAKHFGITPLTFVVPEDISKLKSAWSPTDDGKDIWIMKPTDLWNGLGIEVINKWNQIPKDQPKIIQKYITNPYLIEGRKFDFRVHVLITGMNPLKIYIKDDYKFRMSSLKYTINPNSFSNKYVHLTNVALQKTSPDFKISTTWLKTTKKFEKYLFTKRKDLRKTRKAIDDIVIKTIILAEDFSPNAPYANRFGRYNGYTLLGFDIILDDNLRPWLLEVSDTPALATTAPVPEMIQEMLNIVGYHLPDKPNKYDENKCTEKLTLKNLYNHQLSISEKEKHKTFKSPKFFKSFGKNFGTILETLTIDDMLHLITAIDEKSQCKMFRRIFPAPTSQKYFKFFPKPRYYNYLLTAWETFYDGKEQEGIDKIMELWKLKSLQ